MQIIFLSVLLFVLGLQVEGKKYGLPDPVRRYSLVDPVQRPPRTTTTSSSPLSTPNANAPIYASDFSSGGYFQPETNPQYIRNATCTWVFHPQLPRLRAVRRVFKSECMWTSACKWIHSSIERIQFRSRIRLWVSHSSNGAEYRGACGRCFRIQGYQDPYNPLTKLNTPSIVVKITDCCPVAGNVSSFQNFD
jgi:hypothetical protein